MYTVNYTQPIYYQQKSLSSLSVLIHSNYLSLFQFAQGSAHIWDSHSFKLEEVMREHKETLGTRREAHDAHNQTLEANLDYVIDRKRSCIII